jgi:hypothetical protein
MVSIAAFQAVDPGSIPGHRNFFVHFFKINYKLPILDHTIDMKVKNRLLKVCYVPIISAGLPRLLFLVRPLTELMKQTRQAVHAIKQSILLKCLWTMFTTLYYLDNLRMG